MITDASGTFITDSSGNPITQPAASIVTDTSGGIITDLSGNPVTQPAASILTDASGSLITDSSGNPITQPAASIITDTSGGIITDLSGNPVTQPAASILTDANGSIITDSSGNPITQPAASILTDASGSIITDSSGNPITQPAASIVTDTSGGIITDLIGNPVTQPAASILTDSFGNLITDSSGNPVIETTSTTTTTTTTSTTTTTTTTTIPIESASLSLCPYNGWVDEIELCTLWNQVQGLNANVGELITLVNNLLALNGGGRFKRGLTTPSSYPNMTTTEQGVIRALVDAYNAIYECCKSQSCDKVVALEVAIRIGNLNLELWAAQNLSASFINSQQYFFEKIGELDSNCTGVTIDHQSIETMTSTFTTNTTTKVSTPDLCCPEYSHTDPIVCPILCQLILTRVKRANSEDNFISTLNVISTIKDVYIFLETRLKCFSEERRLELSFYESKKLTKIHEEVYNIKPYLQSEKYAENTEYVKVKRKLLALLDEAKKPITRLSDFVGEEKFNDIVLGCMCLIISPVNRQFSADGEKSCSISDEKIEENLEMVAESYKMTKQGISLNSDMLKDLYFNVEKSKDCGMITESHKNHFYQILLDDSN